MELLFKKMESNDIGNCAYELIKAFKEEPDVFDTEKLQQVVSTLPEEYEIKLMDEELYRQSKDIPWCCDWVSQYPTYEMYQKLGLGVVILKDDEIVSGASSYTSYKGGIEIEIIFKIRTDFKLSS